MTYDRKSKKFCWLPVVAQLQQWTILSFCAFLQVQTPISSIKWDEQSVERAKVSTQKGASATTLGSAAFQVKFVWGFFWLVLFVCLLAFLFCFGFALCFEQLLWIGGQGHFWCFWNSLLKQCFEIFDVTQKTLKAEYLGMDLRIIRIHEDAWCCTWLQCPVLITENRSLFILHVLESDPVHQVSKYWREMNTSVNVLHVLFL